VRGGWGRGALSPSSHLQSAIDNVVVMMQRPQFFFLLASLMRMGTVKGSVQRRRRPRSVIRKDLGKFLPTSVQKSYFMLSDAERESSIVLSRNIGQVSLSPF
jgi:hypothetical protein